MKRKLFFILCIVLLSSLFAGCLKFESSVSEMQPRETNNISGIIERVEEVESLHVYVPISVAGEELGVMLQPGSDIAGLLNSVGIIGNEEPDGTVSLYLDGTRRSLIINSVSQNIEDGITSILSDDDGCYPNIVSILPNSDCTCFDVIVDSDSLTLQENLLVMTLFIFGNKYQLYSGVSLNDAVTTVRYMDTFGNILSESSSVDVAWY